MRYPVPNIRQKLQGLREPRRLLESTFVVAEAGHFVVLTLAPLKTARLMGRGPRACWETRVHTSDPEIRVGVATAPRYAVLSAGEGEALSRHEALVARLEAGSFETETSREILAPIRPLLDRAAEAFRMGNHGETVSVLEEAIRIAGRIDVALSFLHLYLEAYLMRALALECTDPDAAKTAYRDFIQLYAGLPSRHSDVLRGVALAREAIERLTSTPPEDSARRRPRGIVHGTDRSERLTMDHAGMD